MIHVSMMKRTLFYSACYLVVEQDVGSLFFKPLTHWRVHRRSGVVGKAYRTHDFYNAIVAGTV